jgi:RimJ/RimL family protein N-acetyltransferase
MPLVSQIQSLAQSNRLARHIRSQTADWPFEILEISRDTQKLQLFVDFYNSSDQLSWQLTLERFQRRLGPNGKAFLMVEKQTDAVVGTVALKQTALGRLKAAEMGYFMLSPTHKGARSLQSALQLSLRPMIAARHYDCVYGTVHSCNRGINRLWSWSKYAEFAFEAPSPYSENQLNYYIALVNNGKYTLSAQTEALKQKFLHQTPVTSLHS